MTNLNDAYRIDQFIDTFALGHYARVLDALDRRTGQTVAFKVLRTEHLLGDGDMRWEYRAFGNEAEILMKLSTSPNIMKLMDCGYVSSHSDAPVDGQIVSFQQDVRGFIQNMTDHAKSGWRPYLALENLPRANNLYYLMKTNQSGSRWRLPSEEALALAWQFANLLQQAHQMDIVYLDHKLEHVYWDGTQLKVIDFNSSRQLQGDSTVAQEKRKDIHNLCVGVLYSIFTGMSPQKASLRPQPGGMDVVDERYQDINELDFNLEPLLSQALKDLLQRGAAMQLNTVEIFIDELKEVASLHGWDFPQLYTSPSSRDARAQMRAGLRRLREGQIQLREARDLFRDALILEGITEDIEDELRRMIKAINDMLNERVIP